MADPEHYEETYNTSTLLESIAIINSSEFKDFTINTDKVYNIRFKVNANIGAKLNEVSFAHIFNFKHSVLISFESMIGNKECKIFWKLSNCEKFYYLELNQLCNDVGTEFCKRFLMDEIKKGKSGILGNSQSKDIIEIHDIGNENNQNLLILAAMENNVEAVEILLKLGLDVEHGDSEDLFAIEKSWTIYSSAKDNRIREKSDQIILKLLKANSPLPTDYVGFDYDKASKNVQAFIDMCEDLHEDAQDGNIESLKKKIQENQGLYYFYNRDCYSIMDCACELGSPEIVKLLVSFGINPGCYENIEKVYGKMDFKNRKILRKQHECSAKQMPKVHLYILKQKSKIGGNDWKHDKRWKYIEDAFEILDRNESCSKVLKVVATWNNLQIIFDFKQDTVYYLDPTKSESVRGATYKTGKIYIGAQNLMIPEKKYKVIGVIIHELCHFAILLTFMNNFDPYPMGESEVKRRFVEIVVKECRDNSESEAMVLNVYSSYEESHQHSELIVIVVQVLMFYYNNPTKIEELKNIYGELFKYFKEVVEPELERAVEMLKTLQNTENDIKYDNLLESMKTKILHSKLKFQEEEVSFFELIGNDHEILNLLSPKKLRGIILKDEEIKFGTTCANFVKYKIIERKFKNENNPLKYFSYSKWRNIHDLEKRQHSRTNSDGSHLSDDQSDGDHLGTH